MTDYYNDHRWLPPLFALVECTMYVRIVSYVSCTCVSCRISQYVEVIGHLHEDRTVQEFKTTDFGDSFGEEFHMIKVYTWQTPSGSNRPAAQHGAQAKDRDGFFVAKPGTDFHRLDVSR